MATTDHPRFDGIDFVTHTSDERDDALVPTASTRETIRQMRDVLSDQVTRIQYGSLVETVYVQIDFDEDADVVAKAIRGLFDDHPAEVDVVVEPGEVEVQIDAEDRPDPMDNIDTDIGPDEPTEIDPSW